MGNGVLSKLKAGQIQCRCAKIDSITEIAD